MPKNIFKLLGCIVLIAFIAGCGTSARVYKQRKERADQAIAGQEPAVKKTREVLVLEIVKDDPTAKDKTAALPQKDARNASSGDLSKTKPEGEVTQAGVSQNYAETSGNKKGLFAVISPLEYTVQKDDTLQTIAKKFYNSYSKWPLIYEANKDKISDPNRIRMGIVIIIPKLDE